MGKRIVFITNILRQPRCIRRINDFCNKGYDVHVYGFDRKDDQRALPNFDYECIGVNSNLESYSKRLLKMRKSIARIIKREGLDCIYYIFSLDIALATIPIFKKIRYIYEISDLMELQISNKWVSNILVSLNRFVIKKSILNIFTSEGFVEYLTKKNDSSDKTIILPNKLNRVCMNHCVDTTRSIDVNNIRFGFIGAIRTETIYNFIDTIGKLGKHEVHLHGIFTDEDNGKYSIKGLIPKYANVYYHGPFKNPDDFPKIYNNIDLVLCYYYSSKNDVYLEPNKLYEAIFYKCPIIVAEDTFVGNKVKALNIGYTIPTPTISAISDFINSINEHNYNEKLSSIESIPREDALDNPSILFNKIDSIINKM